MGNFKGYDKDWATKELPLRIDLMVSEYRQARDKKAQIDILADQCGTQPCRIAWILDRCGLDVDPKKLPRARRSENSFDYVAHWESSGDAVICDRIRERLEAVEREKERDRREAEQSMPGFDSEEEQRGETEETVEKEPEMVEMWMGGADTEAVPAESDKVEMPAESEVAEAETERPEKWKDPADLRREILSDAAVCVCSDRNLMYGEPEDNFDVIAAMWSAYLGIPVTAADVAAMMILFKVARIATAEKPSRDSYVDIAGYAACGGGMIK